MKNTDINVRNLDIEFSSGRKIDKFSFDFKKDKVTAIIGESGSGKSLLVNAILQLLPEDCTVNGEIIYNSQNLLAMNNENIRKIRGAAIGFIPQNPVESFNKVLKIRMQLDEILKEHNKELNKRQRMKIIEDSLLDFGFENPTVIADSYPMELSGGMMQRVLSLFGTIAKPGWVIADEPTKGLDAILRNQVFKVLKKIQQETTKSMIIVTHDLQLAYHIAEEIVVMKTGEIIEVGEPYQIFHNSTENYTKELIRNMPSNMLRGDKNVS